MLNRTLIKEKEVNTKMIRKITTSICYLAKQEQGLRGASVVKETSTSAIEPESNLQQLLELRCEDSPELCAWLKRKCSYTSPDIQNEILELIANNILRDILKVVRTRWYTIMMDETTDISNTEQLAFVLRHIDGSLQPQEDLVGLYSLPNIKADTLVSVVNDILARCGLDVANLRGQCYDGAAVMSGRVNGVSTQILAKQPKATYIHCFAHTLNLSVQEMCAKNSVMKNVLDSSNEIIKLIKLSPKRETILKQIKDEDGSQARKIKSLCPTRSVLVMDLIA